MVDKRKYLDRERLELQEEERRGSRHSVTGIDLLNEITFKGFENSLASFIYYLLTKDDEKLIMIIIIRH